MRNDSLSIFIMTVALFFMALATVASGSPQTIQQSDRPDNTGSGSLFLKTVSGKSHRAPVLATDVDISVTGLIARVKVRQRFVNRGDGWAEGIYVFPLPEDSAVDHMRLVIGERIIEGQIHERKKARKKYEKAKRAGKRASLVTQERPNIFTTSVANIGPAEEVTVEIEYQQNIAIDAGQYSLRFPMVVGPRYIPGKPVEFSGDKDTGAPPGQGWAPDTAAVIDASRITPPVQKPEQGLINPVWINVDLSPGFPAQSVKSLYHEVDIDEKDDGSYGIKLTNNLTPADRDFVLAWRPKPEATPAVSVYTEKSESGFYTLYLFSPPSQKVMQNAAPAREAIFVIDISGSMHGNSIKQAKAALLLALSRLKTGDTFNVIAFSGTVTSFTKGALPVTPENILAAKKFINSLGANGGTNIAAALNVALPTHFGDGDVGAGKIRQVIFLTDGSVGNESQLFRIIKNSLGKSRLFTVGIGSAPNSHFMRTAAQYGRGTYTYIGKTSEVKEKMATLFSKLEAPALTDIDIKLPSGISGESFPNPIPDLYLDRPVTVVVKTDGKIDSANVEGFFGHNRWGGKIDLANSEERPGIKVAWARQKIEKLMDDYRKRENTPETKNAVRQKVVGVALKHHLVSRFTSLVAVDVTPARPVDKSLNTHAMKTNLPHGWNYTKVFGKAQTATSWRFDLIVGLLSLIFATALFHSRNKRVVS